MIGKWWSLPPQALLVSLAWLVVPRIIKVPHTPQSKFLTDFSLSTFLEQIRAMSESSENRFLIWGSKGWIAGHLIALLHQQHKDVHSTDVRMENQEAVCRVLDEVRPSHVINCAGMTGRPNVDECEHRKLDTIESNVTGTLILTKACHDRDIHITVLATGCMSANDTSCVEGINPLIEPCRHLRFDVRLLCADHAVLDGPAIQRVRRCQLPR